MTSIFDCAKVELLQIYFKYLAFKTILFKDLMTLKHSLSLILINVHRTQVVLQIKCRIPVALYFKVSLLQCNYTFKY